MNEIQAEVFEPSTNGRGMQEIVGLASRLTGAGYTTQQVQAVMVRIRSVAEQSTVNMMNEMLEDMRSLQQAQIARIIQLIMLLPSMGSYVRRDAVLMSINTAISENTRR